MKKILNKIKLFFLRRKLEKLNLLYSELRSQYDACAPGTMSHFNYGLAYSACVAEIKELNDKILEIKNGG